MGTGGGESHSAVALTGSFGAWKIEMVFIGVPTACRLVVSLFFADFVGSCRSYLDYLSFILAYTLVQTTWSSVTNDFFGTYVTPRTDGGADIRPLRFLKNSRKTAARSAAKFCMTIHLSILRDVCKW